MPAASGKDKKATGWLRREVATRLGRAETTGSPNTYLLFGMDSAYPRRYYFTPGGSVLLATAGPVFQRPPRNSIFTKGLYDHNL